MPLLLFILIYCALRSSLSAENFFFLQLTPSMAIYDTMQSLKSPVVTHCVGFAYNLAGFLLAAGEKVHLYSHKNIHSRLTVSDYLTNFLALRIWMYDFDSCPVDHNITSVSRMAEVVCMVFKFWDFVWFMIYRSVFFRVSWFCKW